MLHLVASSRSSLVDLRAVVALLALANSLQSQEERIVRLQNIDAQKGEKKVKKKKKDTRMITETMRTTAIIVGVVFVTAMLVYARSRKR